jgi:hypothetical protein
MQREDSGRKLALDACNSEAERAAESGRELSTAPLFGEFDSECVTAAELGVKPRTLRAWRAKGQGPPWVIVGRRPWYPRSGKRKWVAAKVITPAREVRR